MDINHAFINRWFLFYKKPPYFHKRETRLVPNFRYGIRCISLIVESVSIPPGILSLGNLRWWKLVGKGLSSHYEFVNKEEHAFWTQMAFILYEPLSCGGTGMNAWIDDNTFGNFIFLGSLLDFSFPRQQCFWSERAIRSNVTLSLVFFVRILFLCCYSWALVLRAAKLIKAECFLDPQLSPESRKKGAENNSIMDVISSEKNLMLSPSSSIMKMSGSGGGSLKCKKTMDYSRTGRQTKRYKCILLLKNNWLFSNTLQYLEAHFLRS